MATAEQVALVVIDAEMDAPRLLPFAEGQAVVYSARSPDKEGPNEDAAGLLAVDSDRGVLVVADGLGGQPGGDSAAKITLRRLRTAIEQASSSGTSIRAAILDALERSNQAVLDLGIGAATTFAALDVAGGTLRPYHVGDSGILVVGQRGKVKLQTVAHSPEGYAVEAGMMDDRDAIHHDERHVVSNMVGATDMRIEIGSALTASPRDTALLATDGLFDNLGQDEVVEIVRSGPLERIATELASRASERMSRPASGHPSKPDDLTFVLYRPKVPARGSRRPHQGQ
jgi:serine/threonine protein phosphatase PrpC